MDCSYFACQICTLPYWVVSRQPRVYPCGHGVCRQCDVRLDDRRCPFCKTKLGNVGANNICFATMLSQTESYYTGKAPATKNNRASDLKGVQFADPYDPRLVSALVAGDRESLWNFVALFENLRQSCVFTMQESVAIASNVLSNEQIYPYQLYIVDACQMVQYFDQDETHPEYRALALSLWVEGQSSQTKDCLARSYTDDQLAWVLDLRIQPDIMAVFANTGRNEDLPIKATAWRKQDKRRLVFHLNSFDRLIDSYLSRKLKSVPTCRRSPTYQATHYIKLDISNAFASVDRQILANELKHVNDKLDLEVFWGLYADRSFVFAGERYQANRGIYVGTKSGHKLFAVLARAVIQRFKEKTGFTGNLDYYVDDFLLHCDAFHFMSKEKLVDAFDEACNYYGLKLNRQKVEFFQAGSENSFTFAGKKIALKS